MRDIIAVCNKAALSGIPWAALVSDIGKKVIKFGNERDVRRYLLRLSEMIDGVAEGSYLA